jgi:hypothetical protein
MKTRIYIHREHIDAAEELRHFLVKLPHDLLRIVSITVTTLPEAKELEHGGGSGGGIGMGGDVIVQNFHTEMGNLCLYSDGFLFYDFQVWRDGVEPETNIITPGVLGHEGYVFVQGRKPEPFLIEVQMLSTVIFGKYQNADVGNYPLCIYIEYETTKP